MSSSGFFAGLLIKAVIEAEDQLPGLRRQVKTKWIRWLLPPASMREGAAASHLIALPPALVRRIDMQRL